MALVFPPLRRQEAARLSIYYFHNFPLLFLPVNLIAIPLATVILYGALALLLLGSFGIEFEWIFLLVEWLGGALILLATWTSDIWFSSAEGLSLSTLEVIVLYAFLLAFFHFARHPTKETLLQG